VFVPSAARAVALLVRSAVPDTELLVEFYFDGQYADLVLVPPDRWRALTIQVPRREGARFRPLELRVRTNYGYPPPLLKVGKVEAR
jgi:hypothetical protein